MHRLRDVRSAKQEREETPMRRIALDAIEGVIVIAGVGICLLSVVVFVVLLADVVMQ